MNQAEKLIDGVCLIELRQIVDERGAVLHVLRQDDPLFLGFGECYCSEIKPGMVKAWKKHRQQTQMIAVPVGMIQMVLFDDRLNSVTYGQVNVLTLGRPTAYYRVQIAPGIWYGFACCSEVPALLVNCVDIPHDPGESDMIAMNDARIPYNWSHVVTMENKDIVCRKN